MSFNFDDYDDDADAFDTIGDDYENDWEDLQRDEEFYVDNYDDFEFEDSEF